MKERLSKEQVEELKALGANTDTQKTMVDENEVYDLVSLGDMLEMLPKGDGNGFFIVCNTGTLWSVSYSYEKTYTNKELIDSLFEAYKNYLES